MSHILCHSRLTEKGVDVEKGHQISYLARRLDRRTDAGFRQLLAVTNT